MYTMGIKGYTWVYMGIHGYKGVLRGIKGYRCTSVYEYLSKYLYLRSTIGERILIGSIPRVCVPRFSDAIKFHGLDAILDWLAAWHIWPRFHVKCFDRRELVS